MRHRTVVLGGKVTSVAEPRGRAARARRAVARRRRGRRRVEARRELGAAARALWVRERARGLGVDRVDVLCVEDRIESLCFAQQPVRVADLGLLVVFAVHL